jgi:hypothetical protein
VKDHEYQRVLAQLRLVNTIVIGAPTDQELGELIVANNRADTLGPLLDPTAWMGAHENIEAVTGAARALLDHRRTLRRLAGDRT